MLLQRDGDKTFNHRSDLYRQTSDQEGADTAKANQDGDGNVRNQEKTVSVFLTSLQLCLL